MTSPRRAPNNRYSMNALSNCEWCREAGRVSMERDRFEWDRTAMSQRHRHPPESTSGIILLVDPQKRIPKTQLTASQITLQMRTFTRQRKRTSVVGTRTSPKTNGSADFVDRDDNLRATRKNLFSKPHRGSDPNHPDPNQHPSTCADTIQPPAIQ